MLILPPGHGQGRPLQWRLRTREKWMIGGVLATVAVLIVAVVIALGSGGRTSAHGCVFAQIAGPVGAEEVHSCGAEARGLCSSIHAPGAYPAQAAQVLDRACRKAGLPVG